MAATDYRMKALAFFVLIIAVFAITSILTNAWPVIAQTNLALFALSAISILLSILVYFWAWGYLIRKNNSLPYRSILGAGFSTIYGTLTPLQLGGEFLRVYKLKKEHGVTYEHSLSASMLVKGVKFLVIGVIAMFAILFVLSVADFPPLVAFSMWTGALVFLLVIVIFLLPFSRRAGNQFSRFLLFLSRGKKGFFRWAGEFMAHYSRYLGSLNRQVFLTVFLLGAVSFSFEVLGVMFAVNSVGITMPLFSFVILTVLVALLERTPFLPRGIGMVELVSIAFLSTPNLAGRWPPAQIGAAIIVFGVSRLVIPTLVSLAFFIPRPRKRLNTVVRK